MTTEEKARAYDEALEDMRVIYPNLKGDAKLAIEHAFPALAEIEDERIREGFYKLLDGIKRDGGLTLNLMPLDKYYAYLEKQKDQKPAEWSEEDKIIIEGSCDALEILCNWLKSLRPQPHWKPSNEQITAVRRMKAAVGPGPIYDGLESLYNDLQKLT